ncbi:MAG: hypothetical protein P8046_05840 [Anaerolineales bacterium]
MQIVLAFIIGLALVGISIIKKPTRRQRIPVRIRTDKHLPHK